VDLSITTHHLDGGVVEISPRGEIDIETAHLVRDAVDQVLTTSRPAVIRIDLWWVTFIDSVGIGTLVGAYHTAAVSGIRVVVVNPTEFVYRQLYISGLVGLFGSPRPRSGDAGEPEPVA